MAGWRRFLARAAVAGLVIPGLTGLAAAQTREVIGQADLLAEWGPTGRTAAQTRQVSGQVGLLAEWDLTATVTRQTKVHWIGPMSLKHVGFCGTDGPEQKSGELQVIMSEPDGELTATMVIDGDTCTFIGRFRNGYDGVMHCPDRPDVPVMLTIR